MDSREIVGCIHQLFWSITVKNGEVVPPIDEATAMLDRYIALAKVEALTEAKEAIKNDLKSYRDNGRRDPKGHVRSMMLIDKILTATSTPS